jgi:hypothetical protein
MSDDGHPTWRNLGTLPATRDTPPTRDVVGAPMSRTLAAMELAIGRRISGMQDCVIGDAHTREQRILERVETLAARVEALEPRAHARAASGHNLESSRDAHAVMEQLSALRTHFDTVAVQLERQPSSSDAAREIKQATDDAGLQLAGLIRDIRMRVRVWGVVAALAFGSVAGATSYLGSRGTAKEAANEAVRNAPEQRERVIVVTQPAPGVPAPTPQGAP